MTRVYLGFSEDLSRILGKMLVEAEKSRDDWNAAASLVPSIDAKTRDQMAVEYLVVRFRAKHGAQYDKPLPQTVNRNGEPKKHGPNRTDELLEELGVTAGDVKAWAVHQGILTQIKRGRVGIDIVELYALAHRKDVAS